ncbi:hypothetical protein JCM21738_1669 [Mesobacillus boroniphilus JCM 21738]|uniref:Uncharacterized protein n=1 Tax=Mesobacillus boroniphilus JCM 21738 TaxID=1294265 RepID=W4RKU4_9BACI|nr:hypothetical protein JCM21738_1669 [Mesobacillus boroniphilus JCM 21738]
MFSVKQSANELNNLFLLYSQRWTGIKAEIMRMDFRTIKLLQTIMKGDGNEAILL